MPPTAHWNQAAAVKTAFRRVSRHAGYGVLTTSAVRASSDSRSLCIQTQALAGRDGRSALRSRPGLSLVVEHPASTASSEPASISGRGAPDIEAELAAGPPP